MIEWLIGALAAMGIGDAMKACDRKNQKHYLSSIEKRLVLIVLKDGSLQK